MSASCKICSNPHQKGKNNENNNEQPPGPPPPNNNNQGGGGGMQPPHKIIILVYKIEYMNAILRTCDFAWFYITWYQ